MHPGVPVRVQGAEGGGCDGLIYLFINFGGRAGWGRKRRKSRPGLARARGGCPREPPAGSPLGPRTRPRPEGALAAAAGHAGRRGRGAGGGCGACAAPRAASQTWRQRREAPCLLAGGSVTGAIGIALPAPARRWVGGHPRGPRRPGGRSPGARVRGRVRGRPGALRGGTRARNAPLRRPAGSGLGWAPHPRAPALGGLARTPILRSRGSPAARSALSPGRGAPHAPLGFGSPPLPRPPPAPAGGTFPGIPPPGARGPRARGLGSGVGVGGPRWAAG